MYPVQHYEQQDQQQPVVFVQYPPPAPIYGAPPYYPPPSPPVAQGSGGWFGSLGVLGVIALALTAIFGWKMLSDTSVIVVPKNWADSAVKQDQQQQPQPARMGRP